MHLEHALTELLLAKDYAPQTRRSVMRHLTEFITYARDERGVTEVEQVDGATVRRYLDWLRSRPKHGPAYGPGLLNGNSLYTAACQVRQFLHFCAAEGWLDERAVRRWDMPRRPQKVIQIFTRTHYERLLAAAKGQTPAWLTLRDQALLALLLDTGARATEVVTLPLSAVFLSPEDSYIRVEGKGRKQREMGLGKQARLALYRYIHRGLPASEYPHLFLDRTATPLTANGLDRILYRLKDKAGAEHFQGIRVSAHTFRHSFAVHYMKQPGADIYKLSRLMGHDSVQTTQRYLGAFEARDARQGGSVLDRLGA
jgi:integrase/recombinase XerD